jgi:hypothetical protein
MVIEKGKESQMTFNSNSPRKVEHKPIHFKKDFKYPSSKLKEVNK